MLIGQNLHLDVPRVHDRLLDITSLSPNDRSASLRAPSSADFKIRGHVHKTHPLAAAAAAALSITGYPIRAATFFRLLSRFQSAKRFRHN